MNLRILSIETMIVLAKFWLTHPLAVAILAGHQVGVAISTQLQVVYDMLLALNKRRNEARRGIAELTYAMVALDKRHDDTARALYHHLLALRAATLDVDQESFFTYLLGLCFPDGLAIINRSYLDESGFVEALAEQMAPALRAQMAAIQVGVYNLDELCQAWIAAGQELGEKSLERERLAITHAANGASDDAIRAGSIRSHWIQTVQGLDTASKIMGLSHGERETLFAPLYRSIAAVEKRAGQDDDAGEHNGEDGDLLDEPDDGLDYEDPDDGIDGQVELSADVSAP